MTPRNKNSASEGGAASVGAAGSAREDAGRLLNIRLWVWIAAIAAVALALRLIYLVELHGTPLFSVVLGDGREYDAWAQRIAAGDWMGSEVFYQTPLYPYALGVVYALAGHHWMLVRVLQAALGAASCALLALAGRRFFSERAGVIAAMLLAVYPAAIFFDGLIQKSSLDLFLTTLTLWLLGEFHFRRRWPWLAAAGAAIALLTLNRENARVLYPIVGGWLLIDFRETPMRMRLALAGVLTAAVAVVLLPVGLRNYQVGGEFLISTSQLGPNFYIGNGAGATGSYRPIVPEHGHVSYERADATRLAQEAAGRKLSAEEVSDYWLSRAAGDIRSRPVNWLRLMGRKMLMTVNARELVDTESLEAYAMYSKILRGLSWLSLGVILPLAALGVWETRAQWRQQALLYAIFAGMAASIAVFYVVARYRYPLVPVALLPAAAGAAAIPSIRGRWRASALPGILAAAGVAILCYLPTLRVSDPTWRNLGTELIKTGKAADAVPILQRAISGTPEDASAHFNVGVALNELSEKRRAIEEFQLAVRLRAGYFEAESSLALTLQETGRTAEALEHFREAVRLNPSSSGARCNMGLALSAMGQREEAMAQYIESLRLNPENATAHNAFAGELQEAGRLREAMEHFQGALKAKPDYAEAHSNLAAALLAAGDASGAVQHMERALRLQPDNFGIRMTAGNVLAVMGRSDEAIAQYEQATRLAPSSKDALYALAQAYARAGKLDEAVASLEKARSMARAESRAELAQEIEKAIRGLQARRERRGR